MIKPDRRARLHGSDDEPISDSAFDSAVDRVLNPEPDTRTVEPAPVAEAQGGSGEIQAPETSPAPATQAPATQPVTQPGSQQPVYQGSFEQQLSDIMGKIQNREAFSYDVNADPLYQQYKDRYVNQGKLAMKDTMGKAAGLTGGYGSSYSQAVGQQAYDAQLQGLSEVIPELYGLAYDRYRDQGDDLAKQYSLLAAQRDNEYDRYRDEVSDWRYGQELARQTENEAYERQVAEDNRAYSKQQNAYSNLYNLIMTSGYNPTDEELAAAGMTRAQVEALLAVVRLQNPALFGDTGGGGGSNPGYYYNPGAGDEGGDDAGSGFVDPAAAIAGTGGALGSRLGGNSAKTDPGHLPAAHWAEQQLYNRLASMSPAEYAAYEEALRRQNRGKGGGQTGGGTGDKKVRETR